MVRTVKFEKIIVTEDLTSKEAAASKTNGSKKIYDGKNFGTHIYSGNFRYFDKKFWVKKSFRSPKFGLKRRKSLKRMMNTKFQDKKMSTVQMSQEQKLPGQMLIYK